MRKEGQLGAGEATGVDEARMNGAIRDDDVPRASKSRKRAEVCLVSTGKEQGGLSTDEGCERRFESEVLGKGARDQPGSCSAEAGPGKSDVGGLDKGGVAGHSEVVIGAEREEWDAFDGEGEI